MKKVKVLRPFRDINDHETIYKRGKFITISDDARAAALIDAGLCKEILDIPDEIKDLVEDEGHRFVSDAEKATWNAKVASAIPVTWSELKALCVTKGLRAGQCYRITDYVTTTVQADTQSAGHQFDILVLATATDTLNENAFACRHDGDTYFTNSKLEAWEIKYSLNNDTKYGWADTENGKGVIYYMKDEWGNECGYDFKNILFRRYKTTKNGAFYHNLYYGFVSMGSDYPNGATLNKNEYKWFYTFSRYSNNFATITDASLVVSEEMQFYNNVIPSFYDEAGDYGNVGFILNNIVLETNSGNCYGNNFGTYCCYCTIGNWFEANSIGNNCYENSIGNYFYGNTIGNYFQNNSIGNWFKANSIGNNCYENSIGNDFRNNSIGNSFGGNSIGNNCYENSIGNWFEANSIGNDFRNNSIGNYFQDNSIGNDCNTIVVSKDYVRYIIIENGNQGVTLTSTQTTSSSNYLQNIMITQGVNMDNENTKTISHNTLNDSFKTTYQNANSVTTNI